MDSGLLPVRYENGLVIQGDTLLEVLDEEGTGNSKGIENSSKTLQLPLYIRKIAPKALDGWKQICIKAWSVDQVESWAPILKAKRALLQIYVINREKAEGRKRYHLMDHVQKNDILEVHNQKIHDQEIDDQKVPNQKIHDWEIHDQEVIWLPLSYTGGFEDVFSDENTPINFSAYDRRFSRIQDRDLKLEMAISRLLYPVQLSEEARQCYEQLVKNRFRPALLQLFSGKWNRYGIIPTRAKELFQLKKTDRFLRKELLQKAAENNQPEFAALCMKDAGPEGFKRMTPSADTDSDSDSDANSESLWNRAAVELYRRKPELEYFCGLLKGYPVTTHTADDTELSYNRNKPIGTDGVHLYYEKNWLKEVTGQKDDFLSRCYTHLLLHCLYLHPFQERSQEKDSRLFHLACDIIVEYAVDQIFGPAKKYAWERQWVYDTLRRTESVLTVQYVESCLYRWLRAEETHKQAEQCGHNGQKLEPFLTQLEHWFMQDSHIFWQRKAHKPEKPLASPGTAGKSNFYTEAEKWEEDPSRQRAAEQWAQAGNGLLQAGNKAAGKRSYAAGKEQEEARLTKRQGYDYHTFLRQFMVLKEDRILDLDSYDPVYYTYGLNTYGNIPLVEALETKEVMRLEELVIVIDTSGSCSGKLVRFFLEETWSVFGQEENFFDRFEVRILQCDAVVQEDVKLTTLQEAEDYMKNLMIKGGGGTDFSAAFSYIKGLQKQGQLNHLKGILYFTDGFGTFPGRPPGCRSAFIFLKSRFGQVEVPYWADKLLLELPEGADWEPEYTGGFQVNV